MKKILLGILIGFVVLSLSGIAAAGLIPANEKAKGGPKISPPGLEKVVFIHYKKGYGGVCDNDGICEPESGENPSCADCKKDKEEPEDPTTTCYAFLDKWANWKDLPQDYVIHPDLEATVSGAILASVETWDAATSVDLFGSYRIDDSATWDNDAPDGENEMVFGDYPQTGVIAVAIVWGYFAGPPGQRKIVEFDILFDTDFVWGDATLNPSVMDLQNIATHEIGHGLGLGDLYNAECSEETMHGYSTEGETKKRTLELGDIEGVKVLY